MKKFFLFRKEELNAASVTASDSGQGLSVLALPADNLAFISAGKGNIVLSFNGATKYEESNLTDGESIEKTSVKIPCEVGKEVDLIESILSFISREGGRSIMKFDAVDSKSTFSSVSFDDKIQSKVHINPTKRVTGEPSTQTFIDSAGSVGVDVTSNIIGQIDFGIAENKPLVDYNHEDLDSMSAGDELGHGSGSHHWDNAGTGGTTYDIISNVGTPLVSAVSPYLSHKSAVLTEDDHFIIPTITVSGDYTLYVVYSSSRAHPMYGDADGECFGFTIGAFATNSSGQITKNTSAAQGKFSVRHDGRFGAPATTEVNTTDNQTEKFAYPLPDVRPAELFQVFVIRRDKDLNMYMYNRNGDIVGAIPGKSTSTTTKPPLSSASDFLTDGNLKIERLGTIADITTSSFAGRIARFGVIQRDIGSPSCIKLANDLSNLYKV